MRAPLGKEGTSRCLSLEREEAPTRDFALSAERLGDDGCYFRMLLFKKSNTSDSQIVTPLNGKL